MLFTSISATSGLSFYFMTVRASTISTLYWKSKNNEFIKSGFSRSNVTMLMIILDKYWAFAEYFRFIMVWKATIWRGSIEPKR